MLDFCKHKVSKLTMDAWTIHRIGTNNNVRLGNLYRDKYKVYFSTTGEDLKGDEIKEMAAFLVKLEADVRNEEEKS